MKEVDFLVIGSGIAGLSFALKVAANGVPVAEVTVAEIILASKGFYQRFQYEDGAWANHNVPVSFPGNYNTNVGIIGAGMIGKMVIKMLQNYRLNVYVFDPFLSDEQAAELHCTKVKTLPELFETCLVVSNHLANNPQTVGMINADCFDKMRHEDEFPEEFNNYITFLEEYQ